MNTQQQQQQQRQRQQPQPQPQPQQPKQANMAQPPSPDEQTILRENLKVALTDVKQMFDDGLVDEKEFKDIKAHEIAKYKQRLDAVTPSPSSPHGHPSTPDRDPMPGQTTVANAPPPPADAPTIALPLSVPLPVTTRPLPPPPPHSMAASSSTATPTPTPTSTATATVTVTATPTGPLSAPPSQQQQQQKQKQQQRQADGTSVAHQSPLRGNLTPSAATAAAQLLAAGSEPPMATEPRVGNTVLPTPTPPADIITPTSTPVNRTRHRTFFPRVNPLTFGISPRPMRTPTRPVPATTGAGAGAGAGAGDPSLSSPTSSGKTAQQQAQQHLHTPRRNADVVYVDVHTYRRLTTPPIFRRRTPKKRRIVVPSAELRALQQSRGGDDNDPMA